MKTTIYVEELGFPQDSFSSDFFLRPSEVPRAGEMICCSWKPYDLMVRSVLHAWKKEDDPLHSPSAHIVLRCMRVDRQTGNIIAPPPESSTLRTPA